jgi:Secretion system C-terminal sorting domain
MRYLLTFFAVLSASFSSFSQNPSGCDTIILNASESDLDATLDNILSLNTPNPTDPGVIAERWTYSGTPYIGRGMMNFPLPALPSYANITSAYLYLYFRSHPGHVQGNSSYPGSPYPNPNDGSLYRITQPWSANTVTWNNQPTVSTQNVATVSATTSNTQDQMVNVTALVSDMYLNPSTSFGFEFRMNDEVNYYRGQYYASSNHADLAAHPKLIICWVVPTAAQNLSNNIQLFSCLNASSNQQQFLVSGNASKIELYDLSGRKIYTSSLKETKTNQTITISELNLSTGMYMASLLLQDKIETIKFMVQ